MSLEAPANSINTYLGALGPDQTVLLAAFRIAARCAVDRDLRQLTMAIPALTNLQGMIEEVFGESFTRAISRTYEVDLNGFRLHLATERRPPAVTGPVVALFTARKQTRALLSDNRTTDLVFVPWTEDDVAAFRTMAPNAEQF